MDSSLAHRVVVAAGALLAAGCGEPGTHDTDARIVRATVGAYFQAIDEANGAAICSRLTDGTRRAVAQLQRTSCRKALSGEARRLPAALNGYDMTDVRVDGGQSTVGLNERTTGTEAHMTLKRQAGRWKISDAPGLGQ